MAAKVKADNLDPRKSQISENEICRNCHKGSEYDLKLMRCSRCGVAYCSPECQTANWPFHKQSCKAMQAELARLAADELKPQNFQTLQLWMRLFKDHISVAGIQAIDLMRHPENGANIVCVLRLSRTKEQNRARLAFFYKLEGFDFMKMEEMLELQPDKRSFVQEKQREIASKGQHAMAFAIILVKEHNLALTMPYGIQDCLPAIELKAPKPDWKENLQKSIDTGNYDFTHIRQAAKTLQGS